MFNGNPVYFMGLMVVLGLLPFFLMMVTSYVKIVVVTSLLRNALGVQQIPPAMVMNGLAIILTMFIMGPVGQASWKLASQIEVVDNPSPVELLSMFEQVSPPLREFMVRNTEPYIVNAFSATAKKIWPTEFQHLADKDNFIIILPSFVISELTTAFKVGFLIYLPFIAIDLIVSNILLAMGMMMVSPMTISLPFKLLLFVTLEGWMKICQGLLLSYS